MLPPQRNRPAVVFRVLLVQEAALISSIACLWASFRHGAQRPAYPRSTARSTDYRPATAINLTPARHCFDSVAALACARSLALWPGLLAPSAQSTELPGRRTLAQSGPMPAPCPPSYPSTRVLAQPSEPLCSKSVRAPQAPHGRTCMAAPPRQQLCARSTSCGAPSSSSSFPEVAPSAPPSGSRSGT